MEVPEELYRQVKAKSALEGRSVREVAEPAAAAPGLESASPGFIDGSSTAATSEPVATSSSPSRGPHGSSPRSASSALDV